jgi:hypothetical protein
MRTQGVHQGTQEYRTHAIAGSRQRRVGPKRGRQDARRFTYQLGAAGDRTQASCSLRYATPETSRNVVAMCVG